MRQGSRVTFSSRGRSAGVGVRWVKTARNHMALQARPAGHGAGRGRRRRMIECDADGIGARGAHSNRSSGNRARARGSVPVLPLRRASASRRPAADRSARLFGAQAITGGRHMPPLTRRCRGDGRAPSTGSGSVSDPFLCCCSAADRCGSLAAAIRRASRSWNLQGRMLPFGTVSHTRQPQLHSYISWC